MAQWPEKEAEEQPMFSEEYDWWVTDGGFDDTWGNKFIFYKYFIFKA